MSTTPTVKVTLSHSSGAVSHYKAGTGNNADVHGGLREAIVTCFSRHGDLFDRVELLRADIPGASWSAMDRAGAYPEMKARLERAASDLLDGHDPHVLVTLGADRSLSGARLVTNNEELAHELLDPNKRSLVVPRLLPYQLGGGDEGATAVIFSPAVGGPLKLHSIHPNATEALMAEADLKARGEIKTGQILVHTTVTHLLASVAAGTFKPSAGLVLPVVGGNARASEPQEHPSIAQSPLSAPSPFVN